MIVKRDSNKEERILNELIQSDVELKRQHDLFEKEMQFKQELINARKCKQLTQKEISNISGLSQQAISRLEKGQGGTVETILKYLSSMGYTLSIKENN